MGSVYLAQDTILRREVALKLPLTGTENDPEVRERFLREARSAATLDHPYICRVYDADVVDGRLYLAMAYIEGKSLADLIRAEGMPPRQVVALVGKLAIAMNEAHIRGVVHRDLKPRNVMIRTVRSKREPVIVDFGLARLDNPEDVRMTRTGQVMGTPAYMAPEQLLGNPDEIGPPCDIYALGVMLYELLTGRIPFIGPYPVLVAQILTQPPLPPSSHRTGLDASLDAICLKAMAKVASHRYASMLELALALTGYLKDHPADSVSGLPLVPGARPVEGDSIPTGADTLVSQFLKPVDAGANLLNLGIDLLPPQTSKSPGPVRVPTSASDAMASASADKSTKNTPPRAAIVASAILGLSLLAGIISVITNGDRGAIDHSRDAGDGRSRHPDADGATSPSSARAEESDRNEIKKGAGWVSLFNGSNLDGWKFQPGGTRHWTVEQGDIVGRGPGATQIFSRRDDYTDFHLRVEAVGSEVGGAGLVFRTSYFDDGYIAGRGYNAQINCDPRNGALMGALAGNIRDRNYNEVIRGGEKFTLEVIAVKNHIALKINEITSLDYYDPGNIHTRGHIGLRLSSGPEIRFHKVEIRELR